MPTASPPKPRKARHSALPASPSQVAGANAAFGPSAEELDRARRLVDAFALPENAGKGAIPFEGTMAERLHLAEAEAILKQAEEET